jgi:dolichol-phosphate mannosyltransferase
MNYIVLLAYNEQENIGALVRNIVGQLDKQGLEARIVVVDDGSTDGTAALLKGLKEELKKIDIVTHEKNMGVGKAFESGLGYAGKLCAENDNIITMESDFTNDPAILAPMIAALDAGNDVICSSRQIEGGAYVGFPLKRLIVSKFANMILTALVRIPGLRDYTIFYRGYKGGIIKRLLRERGEDFLVSKGFSGNFEILLRAKKYINRAAEVPLVYRYDLKKSKSKMKLFRNAAEYVKLLWKK